MNYKHAPGRNWVRERKRGRAVHLQRGGDRPSTPGPSSQWFTLANLRNADGRNWTHEPPRKPIGRGLVSPDSPRATVPMRERGAGDHDKPYEYRGPSTLSPFPFTTREYARLLILKSRLAESRG